VNFDFIPKVQCFHNAIRQMPSGVLQFVWRLATPRQFRVTQPIKQEVWSWGGSWRRVRRIW
jgi:hypothetical protein